VKKCYEADPTERKFVDTFTFTRGENIKSSQLGCDFLKNPEANRWVIDDINVGQIEKNLDVNYIPPALKRRSNDTGISPEQYMLEAFMKGKVYSQIYKASVDTGNTDLREIGFVLKANASLRKMMKQKEKENGEIDYSDLEKEWAQVFPELVKEELRGGSQPPPDVPEEPEPEEKPKEEAQSDMKQVDM